MKTKVKMRKLFLFAIILMFLFFLVSCKTTDAEAKIAELEAKITKLEKESKQLEPQAEQKPETTEETKEESPAEEALEEEPEKEFSPTIVGSLYIPGYTTTVYVIGDYAYTSGNGLNIIDISDKANPTIAGSNSISGWAMNLYVEGDYAYLPYGNWDNEGNLSGGGFQIIDITDKKNPVVVGTFESEESISNICITENYIYASYEIFEQKENYAELIGSGIKIIDMADKENLVSVGIYEVGNSGVGSIYIEEDYAYVLTGGTLKILDIANRENPIDKGSYSFSGWAMGFYVEGDYAYLPSSNSLQIIDIADRENPIMTGGVFASGNITDVYAEGDYAYLTYAVRDDNGQIKKSGIEIIDVTDKNNPAVITEVEIPGEAMGIFVEGDYAYVGAGPIGLHIIKLFNE